MDPYGLGAVLQVALDLHEINSRGTGRTTKMINALNPGDLVVIASARERRHILDLLRERGVLGSVQFVTLEDDLNYTQDTVDRWLHSYPRTDGRVHVTHEAAYLIARAHLSGLTEYLDSLASYTQLEPDLSVPMNRHLTTQPRPNIAGDTLPSIYPIRLR